MWFRTFPKTTTLWSKALMRRSKKGSKALWCLRRTVRGHCDFHSLARLHRGKGGLNLTQRESMRDKWFHPHTTTLEKLHRHFVLSWHRAMRAGEKRFAVVNLVRIQTHRSRILAKPTKEVYVPSMCDHLHRLFVCFHRSAGGDYYICSPSTGRLQHRLHNVGFRTREIQVRLVLLRYLHPKPVALNADYLLRSHDPGQINHHATDRSQPNYHNCFSERHVYQLQPIDGASKRLGESRLFVAETIVYFGNGTFGAH